MDEQNGYQGYSFQGAQQYQPQYQPNMQYQPPHPMRWYNAYKIISLIFGILGTISAFMTLIMTVGFSFIGNMDVSGMPGSEGMELQMLFRIMSIIMIPSLVISLVSVVLHYVIYRGLSMYRKRGLIAIYIEAGWNVISQLAMLPLVRYYIIELMNFINAADPAVTMAQFEIDIMMTTVTLSCIIGALINGALYTINAIYFHKRKDVFK